MRLFVAFLIVVLATQAACNRLIHQQDFESPEAAAQALVNAVRSGDLRASLEVLGKAAEPVLNSGDLVLREGRYRFDSAAGIEEIINRRVGANEPSTIQSCLAFVDAQREYYVRNAQRDSLLHFAQKLVSSDGRKDGLYWPTADGESPSPLGEAFARARGEGYFEEGASKPIAYHGYVYRLLTSQGPHAAGGAYDYMVRDKMLGGFALMAFPAEYGLAGVMTFIVNHDGVVFSKDLGAMTATAVQLIESFDPDPSWTREAAIN